MQGRAGLILPALCTSELQARRAGLTLQGLPCLVQLAELLVEPCLCLAGAHGGVGGPRVRRQRVDPHRCAAAAPAEGAHGALLGHFLVAHGSGQLQLPRVLLQATEQKELLLQSNVSAAGGNATTEQAVHAAFGRAARPTISARPPGASGFRAWPNGYQ